MAFSGGVFGACAGGIQGFVILGIVGIGAMALNAAGISFLLNVAFGYWLFPAIWFTGYCVALSFASKRGLCDGKALTTPLIILRSPAVLVVGGVAGVAGYALYYLCNNVLGFRADNGAVAVVTICLLWKLLTEKTFIGRPSNVVQAKGGRFSTRHDQHWIPYLHDGPTKLVFGLALSGASAAAVYAVGVAYGALDDLSIWASHTPVFISFFISAATLVFAVSSDAAASHQTTLSAGYAFCYSAATGCDICYGFVVASCVFQHNAGFTVKRLQLLGERSQSFRAVGHIERQPNDLSKWAKHRNRALSAGNIDTCCVHRITPVLILQWTKPPYPLPILSVC